MSNEDAVQKIRKIQSRLTKFSDKLHKELSTSVYDAVTPEGQFRRSLRKLVRHSSASDLDQWSISYDRTNETKTLEMRWDVMWGGGVYVESSLFAFRNFPSSTNAVQDDHNETASDNEVIIKKLPDSSIDVSEGSIEQFRENLVDGIHNVDLKLIKKLKETGDKVQRVN